MPKKIYDIKPPRVARKTENDIKDFLKESKKKAPRATSRKMARREEEKKLPWKAFVLVGVFCFIILFGFLYFKLQKVTVEIWPSVDALSYSQVIAASKSADAISLDEALIPAKYIEIEKSVTQQFVATGNGSDEGKATGNVTMYNTSSTSLTLKNNTHLLSDSGKYFITLSKVTIPKGSKSNPGSVQVRVQASEGGESYNIGPANFSVPKLSGTNYYYSTYAVSTEAMAGGYTGDVKKITDDDIAQAEDNLVESVSSQALQAMKDQLGDAYIVLDDAVYYETIETEADAKSGTIADSFDYTATIKATAVAFKKADLDKICKDYIILQMESDKTLLDSSFTSEYTLKSVDLEEGAVALNVNFSAGTYKSINKNSLALSLMGKNSQEITEIINSDLSDSTARINIDFWPFWVRKAPNNQKSINVELKF